MWPVGWKTETTSSSAVDWAAVGKYNGTNLHHELVYESLVFSGCIGNLLLRDGSLDLNFPEFGTVRM